MASGHGSWSVLGCGTELLVMVNDRLKVGLLLDVVHMEGHKRRFDRLFNVWVLIDGFLDHAAELVL